MTIQHLCRATSQTVPGTNVSTARRGMQPCERIEVNSSRIPPLDRLTYLREPLARPQDGPPERELASARRLGRTAPFARLPDAATGGSARRPLPQLDSQATQPWAEGTFAQVQLRVLTRSEQSLEGLTTERGAIK